MEETYTLRDALKQVLHVNDDVVFSNSDNTRLNIGTVISVSKRTVMIKYPYSSPTGNIIELLCCQRNADCVVRVTQQVQIAKDENPEEYNLDTSQPVTDLTKYKLTTSSIK